MQKFSHRFCEWRGLNFYFWNQKRAKYARMNEHIITLNLRNEG